MSDSNNEVASELVDEVFDELKSRRGLDTAINRVDDETLQNIKDALAARFMSVLEDH